MGMKLKIGSPVSGSNFYPRREVINRLRDALERDHVSFLAPRRTGKTSVLIHLVETADADHPHLRINLETCTRPDHALHDGDELAFCLFRRGRENPTQERTRLLCRGRLHALEYGCKRSSASLQGHGYEQNQIAAPYRVDAFGVWVRIP